MTKSILNLIYNSPQFKRVADVQLIPEKPLLISGVTGSLWSLMAAHLFNEFQKNIIVVLSEKDFAEKLRDDLSGFIGIENICFYTSDPKLQAEAFDVTPQISKIETLFKLIQNKTNIIITHVAAIANKVPNPQKIKSILKTITRGSQVEYDNFISFLNENGFNRKNFVETYGDYSVRGGIIDLFPFLGENPYRLEFWGDMLESIREFEILSQRSIREVEEIFIFPDLENQNADSTIFDFIKNDSIIFYDDTVKLKTEFNELDSEGIITDLKYDEILNHFCKYPRIEHKIFESDEIDIKFSSSPQPTSQGSIKTLKLQIEECIKKNLKIWIISETKEESIRLNELLHSSDLTSVENNLIEPNNFLENINFVTGALHDGFIFTDAKIAIFTEHQIFGRLKERNIPKRKRFKGISQKELHQLKSGDFVVHVDHGIGKFKGMKKISIGGNNQEVVNLEYANSGTLFVNINYINRIQKYSSGEGFIPTLNIIGGKEWDRTKQRAKKKIKDIARDLIKIYAVRKNSEGFGFLPDTPWQKEMEASFMYDDTPDQSSATISVKKDMESNSPMDRLICGDVGFGKTEVAVRAAFKAVMSGKQVAVLVPTTILAEQHGNTFTDRLGRYSTKIEVLSRFRSPKEIKKIVENISLGQIDIVIGTHRLLSKDVVFKNLGLLIIDEEQRFGVSAKEKLRSFKNAVDTLTLTATPIPRTLQFSLMGARDLSIIMTPPRNRYPIHTEIALFDKTIIREAIIREIHRGGQVYIVHDRIGTIDDVVSMLKNFVSEAKFVIAHGQMNSHKLEKVMMDFLERKFNVLVSTKIIESGIDIPSVNTIIINRADRFGMAELYQLRGRVGRSNIQAYAYLLVPPFSNLSKETLRRLQTVEEFTELGSGFNLAMRDLEIRGSGNLLGSEQSGFIAEMGFEMYQRLVNEAVYELKEEEFEETFKGEKQSEVDVLIEVDIDAFISDEYVHDNTERLDLYRRIARIKNENEITSFNEELRDRFGTPPIESENLFLIANLKLIISKFQFTKFTLHRQDFNFYFPSQSEGENIVDGFIKKFSTMTTQAPYKLFFKEEKNKLILHGKINNGSDQDRLNQIITLLKQLSDNFNADTKAEIK
ncbi:MAG: transcription-repair coupling factor [Bacteroidetes bacterium]|nr:transcription-repair coupling factor [Bacteroidota bacterium]